MAKKSACDAETVIFSFCTAAGFVLTLLTAWLLMKFQPKVMNDIGKTLGVVEKFGETTITIPSLPKGAFGGMFGSDDKEEKFIDMGGFMGFGKKDKDEQKRK